MKEEKQVVEGGQLLNSIVQLFFKGLDSLIGSAAEYRDDFGVLTRVSKIPVKAKDGKEYSITIELAPVKDKEDLFFVTAKTDAPNLDITLLNQHAFKLSKNTVNKFNDMIREVVEKSGYSVNLKDDEGEPKKEETSEEETSEEETSEEETSEEETSEEEISEEETSEEELPELDKKETDAAQKLIDKVVDEVNDAKCLVVDTEGHVYAIVVVSDYDKDNSPNNYYATFEIRIKDEDKNNQATLSESEVSLFSKDGELIEESELENEVVEYIRSCVEDDNELSWKDQQFILNSVAINRVKATFIKAARSRKVRLTAINASSDIRKAMDVVCSILEEDEFVDALSEDPQSFEIIEYEDGYDVNPIDSVDTDLFVFRN